MRRCASGLLHQHRLDVAEFVNSKLRQLASVAAFFDAPERKPGVRAHVLVDECKPAIEFLGGDALTACEVPRKGSAPEAEARVVDDANGIGFAPGADDSGDRTEDFFVMGGFT